MKANEFISEAKATKTRLDPKCWSGKKIGTPKTKVKGGVRVNNCVPAESIEEAEKRMSRAAKGNEKYGKDGMKALAKAGREGASEKKLDAIRDKHDKYNESIAEGSMKHAMWADAERMTREQFCDKWGDEHGEFWDNIIGELDETAAWRRKEGKSKTGGLNKKGVASYRRENPGSKLQTAVTTKPSKLKKGSKAAKRRKSFCARMGGVKGPMKKPNGKPTRKALALRKWNCESVEQLEKMLMIAESWAREKGIV